MNLRGCLQTVFF